MASLPKFVVLQSSYNKKYLQFVHQDGDLHGFLRFSGNQVVSPYTKLQVEVSQSDNNLVHLKCCYNNKYWAASSQHDNSILAGANNLEEDQTKLSCTLFRPTFVDAKTVRLTHVNLGKFAALANQPGQAKDECLHPQSSESRNQDFTDVFTVIDWSSQVVLPRYVAFKIHNEDKYLSATPVDNENYLQFIADDIWDPTVGHEVIDVGDGSIKVKSEHYGKFWTRDTSSFILAKTEDEHSSSKNILFVPEIVGEANVVALLSSGNGDYCKRISIGNITNGLSAADKVITDLSKLEVIERVLARSVHDIKFQVLDAKINDTKQVTLETQDVPNDTSEAKNIDFKFEYSSETAISTWNSSANGSLTVGVKTAIDSGIPVADKNGNIEISDEFIDNILWGKPQTTSVTPAPETVVTVTVPAMTKATVKAMGNMDSWEIPFFYTQTNTFVDGSQFSFKMEDGNYTGSVTVFDNYAIELTPIG